MFFDWDRADLTDRARQIIREAAENSTRVQYTRIEVNGYTDTSGTAAYNQRLSVRRAQAVAAELVRNGVPRQAITIQGFGETHLLVPTGGRRARAAEPPRRDHHPLNFPGMTGSKFRGASRRPDSVALRSVAPNSVADHATELGNFALIGGAQIAANIARRSSRQLAFRARIARHRLGQRKRRNFMRFRGALLTASFLAAPGLAQAQPFEGIYIGAGAGYNYLENVDTRASPGLGTPSLKINGNSGFTGLASVGYGFGNGIRLEVEGNYRQTQVHRISGTPFPTTAGGRIQNYGAMLNVLFDMDIGVPWLYPYLGLGAGYGWTHLNQVYAAGTNFPFSLRTDDTVGNFAWQVIAGLSFPIPDVPGLSITAEYRFYSIIGPKSVRGLILVRASGSRERPLHASGRGRQSRSPQPVPTTARCSAFVTPSTSRPRASACSGRGARSRACPLLPRVLRLG